MSVCAEPVRFVPMTDTLDQMLAVAAGPDVDHINLAEAALILAAYQHPSADLNAYRDHLQDISHELKEADPADAVAGGSEAGARAETLARVLHGLFQYTGDEETYDDLDNANLMRVIDRRVGLPVSLGILYIHAARAAGWTAEGLAFPGHFLIRVHGENGDSAIVDPFHQGRVLDARDLRDLLKAVAGQEQELGAEHYTPVSDRAVLVRLINNIKSRRLEAGQVDEALAALDQLRTIEPDDVQYLREAGLMNLRLGQIHAAIENLDAYLAKAPGADDHARISLVLDDLRERLN